ncbi:MAG: hypothetical protein KAV82_08485 [Phycisphaerae bacterium]|nr:hypothetical protein [Phycisphaerae bacterium]
MKPTEHEFSDIEFTCPQCGEVQDGYQEQCPHCGHELAEEYCATYHPSASPLAKVVAYIVLAGGVLMGLAILWSLLCS